MLTTLAGIAVLTASAPWFVWAMIAYQMLNFAVVVSMALNGRTINVGGNYVAAAAILLVCHVLIYAALLP